MFRIIGIEYGTFENNNWARAHIIMKIQRDRGDGWKEFRDAEKKPPKIDYNLAMNILADWSIYENQEININSDLRGRIIGIELAG